MLPQYTPWQQPTPAQPQPAAPYAPPSPYGIPPQAPASLPSYGAPPQAPTPAPVTRVLPLIDQANALLVHITAEQLALLFLIAAVGKRTNSHPYFPLTEEQPDLQVLRQFQMVEAHGQGYTVTPMGDAIIVAERLNRLAVLA